MVKKILSLILSFLVAAAGFLPPEPSYAEEKEEYTIAVLDLTANGISESEARSLSESLRAQVSKVVMSAEFIAQSEIAYSIIERAQMEKILDEYDFQSTGCTDVECAIELGQMLSAQRIVIGSVGLVGNTYNLTVRMIDLETSKYIAIADYKFTGRSDNLLNEGIPNVVNDLFFGEKKKSNKKLYYIIGGIVLSAGALAAVLGSSSGGDNGTTGTITYSIPIPQE